MQSALLFTQVDAYITYCFFMVNICMVAFLIVGYIKI